MAADLLFRGSLKEPAIRFAYTECPGLCSRGIVLHDADPVAGRIFAEALLTGALLSVLLDDGEKYSLRFAYSGAAGSIVIEARAGGAVRGIPGNPHLAQITGGTDAVFGRDDAQISLVKSQGGTVLNSGLVKSALASPAADAGLFLSISDQVETEIAADLSFRPDPADPVARAFGLMLQAMPGCDLEHFGVIRERLHTTEFAALLGAGPEFPEEKLRRLLAAAVGEYRGLAVSPGGVPEFRCDCSPESMKRAMSTLGPAELERLWAENPEPGVSCGFCRKAYRFRREDF